MFRRKLRRRRKIIFGGLGIRGIIFRLVFRAVLIHILIFIFVSYLGLPYDVVSVIVEAIKTIFPLI